MICLVALDLTLYAAAAALRILLELVGVGPRAYPHPPCLPSPPGGA